MSAREARGSGAGTSRERRKASDAEWLCMGEVPVLDRDAVHVWRADVDSFARTIPVLAALLDAGESSRARAFHAVSDADRYVIAHGLLRALLARYVDADAAALRFETGLYGKPRLDTAMPANGLRFNMSHTHDMIVFAFARDRDVGVDVERWTPDVECLELAQHFFSRAESGALAALPRDAQRAAFFDCWSRKESYIKATGLGVSHGLDHFDVSLAPDDDAALIADRSAPDATYRWRMRDLGLARGHSGAVVAERMDWHLERFVASPALVAP